MNKKTRWQIVLASLVLTLVACEQTITSVVAPVVEAEPTRAEAPPAPTPQSTVCVEPGTGLISWWAADGHFSDIALLDDGTEDPNPNHVTIVSNARGERTDPSDPNGTVTFADGRARQAFSFTPVINGEASFLEIPDAIDLRPADFTVDLWAMRTGTGQNDHDAFGTVLIQKEVAGGISYAIWWNWDGQITATVNFGGALHILGRQGPLYSPGDTPASAWVHVALTVQGSTATLYLNGVAVETSPNLGGAPVYGSGPIIIGGAIEAARLVGYPRGFHGLIDEVDLYGRTLTADEIAAIYNAGASGKCKGAGPEDEPANGAPSVVLDDASLNEGDAFEPTGSFADDDSESWMVEVDYGDGDGDTGVFDRDAESLFPLHHYNQDGTYTVTVNVTDNQGATGSTWATVTVLNVAPTVDAGPDASVLDGGLFESEGHFSDPGHDPWTATVDYGDGTGVAELDLDGNRFQLSHVYEGNGSGPFEVTVTVSDDDDSGADEAFVTVIYPLTIDKASVKLSRSGRVDQDDFDVDGRLPLGLLQRFDPTSEAVTIRFAGFVQEIAAGSFVRKDDKWDFKAPPGSGNVWRMDLHDDGRFKIRAKGPVSFDLRGVDYGQPFDVSLWIGPDISEASVELDQSLHYRSPGGDHDDHVDDDDDDDVDDGVDDVDDDDGGSDKSEKSNKSEKSDKSDKSDKSGKSAKSGA